MNEQIVLVDKTGKQIGIAPKLATHHGDTPLHLAFSCFIFDGQGNFLLTRRALVKKVWPGVWTNSVCGHPAPGEKMTDAIKRRLDYELGIKNVDNLELLIPDYTYKTPPFKGVVEHEYCPVYAGIVTQKFTPNPDEVENYEWAAWDSVLKDVKANPNKYSYWFKQELELLLEKSLLNKFIKA